MNEIWRKVIGFPMYAVSNRGRIKRIVRDAKNHKCAILKPWLNNKGYKIVCLASNGNKSKRLVSRLVCEAFKGPSPSEKYTDVAHRDGNPENNIATNLRWATRSQNMEDSRRHGTMALGKRHGRTTKPHLTPRGERHGHAKLTEKQVLRIRSSTRRGVDLAQRYMVSTATISTIRSGNTWRHL